MGLDVTLEVVVVDIGGILEVVRGGWGVVEGGPG